MKKSAFTLVELLVVVSLTLLVIGGVFSALIRSVILNEYNERFSVAMNIARAKIEEAIGTDYDSLVSSGGVLTVVADGMEGSYQVLVDEIVVDSLKNIRVAVCWRGRGENRIIGSDNGDGSGTALNGLKDGTEQVDADGGFYSPCVLTSAKANR